jgi:signal transduction histidine kinase
MNYRSRIALSISVIGVLIFIMLTLSRIFLIETTLRERAVSRMNIIGKILTERVLDNLLDRDFVEIHRIVESAARQQNIEFTSVVDDEDIVRFSSKHMLENKPNILENTLDINRIKGNYFVNSFPLVHDENSLGYVQICFSLNELKYDLRRMLYSTVIESLIALSLIMLLAWLISGNLLKPLEEMRDVADRIAKGDFSPRVSIKTKDIIGELGFALNNMVEKLDDLTSNLENKIKRETYKLELSNAELQEKTKQLQESNKKLLELDNLKSEFVAIVSHELRTPLTGIIGFSDTLLSKNIKLTDEQKKRYLKYISQEGNRLASLIEDFLDISKIETGNIRLDKEPLNLTKIISETLDTLEVPKDFKVEVKMPEHQLHVQADRGRIKQVLLNILSNALKYAREGGKIILTGEDREESVLISIEDNGPGIRKEDIGKVFNKFFRGSREMSSNKQGSGLGLAIARGIVEMHGGKIWVESEEGRGCRFSFILPKKNPVKQADDPEAQQSENEKKDTGS